MPRDGVADRQLRDLLDIEDDGAGYPLAAYDIGCDEGAWNHFLRKLWCGAQSLPFAFGKWAIGIGIDLMGWALEFRIADALGPIAGLLARVYETSLVGPLGVRHLAWTAAVFVAGWHLLRSRFAQGAGEIASTFLISAVGAIVLANPQGYLEGSVNLAQNSSGAILEAVDGTLTTNAGQGGAEQIRERLSGVLRRSFVAEPYDLINWGEPLRGECAAARDEILAGGPWGSDDEPRDIMRDHGCDDQAEFNAQPSDNRAAASTVTSTASIVATVLLVLVALVVFVAQITLVFLFASAPMVWAIAMFPGARGVLWWWLGRIVWAVVASAGATFVMSWLAVSVAGVLDATQDMSIVQRSLVTLLLVAFGFKVRSQIGRAADGLSRRMSEQMRRINPADRHSRWPGLAAAGAAGFGLSTMLRDAAHDVPLGAVAYNRMYYGTLRRGRYGRRRGGYRGQGGVQGGGRLVRQGNRFVRQPHGTQRRAGRVALAAGALTGLAAAGGLAGAGGLAVVAAGAGAVAAPGARRRVTARSTQARERLRAARDTAHRAAYAAAHPVATARNAVGPRVEAARSAGRRVTYAGAHPVNTMLGAVQTVTSTPPPPRRRARNSSPNPTRRPARRRPVAAAASAAVQRPPMRDPFARPAETDPEPLLGDGDDVTWV